MNVKLPTGYGKTYTAAGVYSILKSKHRVTRVLYIVPRKAQLDQIVTGFKADLIDACVDGPLSVTDLRFIPANECLKRHRQNTCQIFVTTIQAAAMPAGRLIVQNLLQTGQWLIVVDEYHHYGEEKAWGLVVRDLQRAFLLCMSATPYRPDDDSAFGTPDVIITYRQAVEEKAVKPLAGHAYDYRLDVFDEQGNLVTYTTEQLVNEAGGDGDKIEKLIIRRRMRWSPKYVSPLIHIPITRMQQARARTGLHLQALVSAMCVSHAELVCTQLRSAFPELKIDWVGTGENGRSDEENDAILKQFCPPKDDFGKRHPTLDVLVHVGIAGEGLDAMHVCEIILLRTASLNNQTNQIIGRGARHLDDVVCNVSFDASTDFARKGYKGRKVEDAMDELPARDEDDDEENKEPPADDPDIPELPDEPKIQVHDMELISIDSGDIGVQRMADFLRQAGDPRIDWSKLADRRDPEWEKVIDAYRIYVGHTKKEEDERAIIAQWDSAVEGAVSVIASLLIRHMTRDGMRVERSMPGDLKRRINSKKKGLLGEKTNDVMVLRNHYQWLKELEVKVRKGEIPEWLR